MPAEVKARITVDAADALKRIEEINKASGYAAASMSTMAKEISAANAALGASPGANLASKEAFRNIAEQLEKQALAYTLVDDKSKAAAQSASLYRGAIINLTKSGSLTKEQTDELVRSYNNYKTAAESAKRATDRSSSSFGQATKTSEGFLKRIATLAKNILVFQLLLGPIRKAVSGVSETIRDSMKVAAEAEQIFNKLSTVFSGVNDSAESLARTLSSSLGVAGSTAASALSTVGDLLQAQGMGISDSLEIAAEWVSKFQDIIAFKDINMSLEEFAQNFMSGAAGNLRNFRTFGSIVKESAVNAELAAKGLDKLTGSQLELAKMTTRAEMALRQQANAMGATEREWDTMLSVNRRLNEAWKEYKENLGSSLNEFIKPAKSWLTEILDYTNDVTRMLKEIDGGEFTVKVEQATSDQYLNEIRRIIMSLDSSSDKAGNLSLWDRVIEAVALASGATMTQIYSNGRLSATQLRDVMLTTGATPTQLVEASSGSGIRVTEEQAEEAYRLVLEYRELQEAVDSTKRKMLSSAEAYDSFTESLASLPHIKGVLGTSFASSVEGLKLHGGNYQMEAGSLADMASMITDYTVQSTLQKMGALDVDSFIDSIDKAFGLGDTEEAYKSWLNEIKDLYTILYNRQVEFGDVSDETLGKVVEMWGKVNAQMTVYKDLASLQSGMAGAQGTLSDRLTQMGLNAKYGSELGANEFNRQKAEADAKAQYEAVVGSLRAGSMNAGMITDAVMEAIVKGIDNGTFNGERGIVASGTGEILFSSDQVRQLIEARKAYSEWTDAITGYYDSMADDIRKAERTALAESRLSGAQSWAQFRGGISETQYTGVYAEADRWLDEMMGSLSETLASMFGQGYSPEELNRLRAEGIKLIEEEHGAKKKEIDAANEAAEALKKIEAWQAVGNRALGSTGTLGAVISAFTEGEGDVWSKVADAVLTIMENTEAWGEMAEMLNRMFAMFEPVADALVEMLVKMQPLWDIVIFCLKVIASTVVMVQGAVNGMLATFKMFWENIKEAFRSLGQIIAHPVKAAQGKLDLWNWSGMDDDTNEKTLQYLKDIWSSVDSIDRNTAKDDYSKQLALLKGLYSEGVLNLSEYSGSIARVTGSPLGGIESYSGASYASGYRGVTYFSGDIVINGYDKDPQELALEIERVLERRAQAGGDTY